MGSEGRVYAFGGYIDRGGNQQPGRGPYALVEYEPKADRWSRSPGLEAFEFVVEARKVVGRIDDSGGRRREIVKEDVVERGLVPVEVPSGRADALGKPHWLAYRTWAVFDPGSRVWTFPLLPRRVRKSGDAKAYAWQQAPVRVRVTPTVASSAASQLFLTGGLEPPDGAENPGSSMRVSATTESFDAIGLSWRESRPMKTPRYLHGAAFDAKGRLFVFGGSGAEPSVTQEDGESAESFRHRVEANAAKANTSLASVEMYDPATNTWTERAPLPTPRQAMGADLGADGRIYVVGGAPSYAHPRPMAVVEIYDPESDIWETGPSMHYARRGHAVVATPEGKLYAIGGVVGRRQRTLREQLAGDFVDPALGATVEMLDTRPGR